MTCKKAEARQGKIYVGKLPAGDGLGKEELEAHFQQFGEVVEVVRPVDKMKNNEPKTFAFITFAREEAAKTLVKQVSCPPLKKRIFLIKEDFGANCLILTI